MAEGSDEEWYQPRTKTRRVEEQSRAYEDTSMTNYKDKQISPYGCSDTKEEQNEWVQTRRIEHLTQTQGEEARVHERISRTRHEDKRSGTYGRLTMKEKVSSGETYVERPTGRVGFKDERKRTSTMRIGDKSGYTEYYTEERVARVNFGSKNNGNSRLAYDED